MFIIDNDWLKASITNVVALALTGIGMIHSPGLLFTESYSPNLGFVAVYCVLIVGFLVLHLIKFNQKAHQADLEAEKAAARAVQNENLTAALAEPADLLILDEAGSAWELDMVDKDLLR